jgi:hypothetical protein
MSTSDNPIQPSAKVAVAVGLVTEPPNHHPSQGLTTRVKTILIGKSRYLSDHPVFQDLSLSAFLARMELRVGDLLS